MKVLRQDYYASRLCSMLAGDRFRANNLLDRYEMVEVEDMVAIVGETAGRNVCAIYSPELEQQVSFYELIRGLRDGVVNADGNPYQITEPMFTKWSALSPELFPAITELQYSQAHNFGKSKPWLFTGYAEGGQLAQIAAAQFKPARLVTFGSAMAGGELLTEATEDACFWTRYEMEGDYNSKLPLRLGKSKGGKLSYITSEGVLELSVKPSYKMQDWFQRTPMESYGEWLDEAVAGL